MTVVLLARTYDSGKQTRRKYAGTIRDLSIARLASTFGFRVLDGSPTTRVYVAPRTRETSRSVHYRYAVLLLARQLVKTPDADLVVHQILEDGSTEPVDLAELRSDHLL